MILNQLKTALINGGPLTVRHLAVLLFIHQSLKKVLFREIAIFLHAPRPSIARAIDTLCVDGLVKRIRSDDDGRDVYLELTKKGEQLANAIVGTK